MWSVKVHTFQWLLFSVPVIFCIGDILGMSPAVSPKIHFVINL
jgi:hypothetical protein